jgi:RimJ/RimL family protein N-acetyltransferase
MRHDLRVSGHAFRLRPVDEQDADFIVDLRRRGGRFLNQGAASISEQLVWLSEYFERVGDFYFVVESMSDQRREGLLGLYDCDPEGRAAEWGRWVLEPDSNAAVESALLIYRCAFEALGIERVGCRTLAGNRQVIAFHESCGLAREADLATIEHNGEMLVAVVHTLTRAEWPSVRTRLDRLASRFAARRVAHRPHLSRL